MIKLIVETVTSERDLNGNCYHAAIFVSTRTGERMTVRDIGGESNARGAAREAGLEWDELYCTQAVIPKRQWQHTVKGYGPYLTGEQLAAKLKALTAIP